MNAFLAWWCTVKPKAKWLILWAAIYFITCLILLAAGLFKDWNWLNQMLWLFISSIPLWNNRLASWLDMKPRLSDWFKRKLK